MSEASDMAVVSEIGDFSLHMFVIDGVNYPSQKTLILLALILEQQKKTNNLLDRLCEITMRSGPG